MAEDKKTTVKDVVVQEGLFKSALKRSVKDIKEARATGITDDAEMSFRRMVEDLVQSRKRLEMTRDEMLDMSPESAISLVLAKNFDGRKFASEYLNLGVEIRLLNIQIDIGKQNYKDLFGGVL